MGPCTYLVTGAVTGDKSLSTIDRIKRTYSTHGVRVSGSFPEPCLSVCLSACLSVPVPCMESSAG
jgi:hypothetical protein